MLPDYHQLADLPVDDRPTRELPSLIEQAITTAGYHFWYLAVVGGAAWKIEHPVRRFMDRHRLDSAAAARLLSGLTATRTGPAPHAVHSLDWFHPTAGERPRQPTHPPTAAGRRRRNSNAREWSSAAPTTYVTARAS